MPGAFDLVKGEKYALVAVDCRIASEVPDQLQIGDGWWACRTMGIRPPPHWKEWIGTIRIDRITKADLILLARAASRAPKVIDEENETLQMRANDMFWGLALADFLKIEDIPLTINGAHNGTEIDVRSHGELDPVLFPAGLKPTRITEAQLLEAGVLAKALKDIAGERYMRLWRSIYAFRDAAISDDVGRRIHEFVRCVEGFILPDQGKTEKQFKTRTELFLGPKHHELTGQLYRVRSAVEHLHGPEKEIDGARERRGAVIFVQRSVEAEALARYCVRRVLLRRDLWSHFETDDALQAFWKLSHAERTKLWGDQLDIAAVSSGFDARRVREPR